MRCSPIIFGIALLVATKVSGQPQSHLYTHAAPPSVEALDRLSLKMSWFRKVPVAGVKDGIASIQLLEIPPEKKEDPYQYELLIQTKSGLVQLRDAENGDLKWSIFVGMPYGYFQAPAFNSHSIYVTRETRLFALNRQTGKHRLFQIDTKTGVPVLGVPILNAPSTAMIADEAAVFMPSDNRITSYLMPKASNLQVNLDAPKAGDIFSPGKLESSPMPKFQATYLFINNQAITTPMVMYREALGVYADNGSFHSINKFSLKELLHFKTYGIALSGLGHYESMVYVGSSDYTVYALNIISSKLRWRFLSGSPIVRTPQATEPDVFVTNTKSGLHRVDREDGNLIWKNLQGDRFLATNGKFVYALDKFRFLLVLDYLKGTTLSRYDVSDFVVPYSNTITDRIYLANHDGSVLCLRHQNFKSPYRVKNWEE